MAAAVPRLFPGRTIACLATGPSLTRADVQACRGRLPVIAVNDAVRWAPWADVLYACDAKWWDKHPETTAFAGLKVGQQFVTGREDVHFLKNTGDADLETEPTGVRTGKNSGYQAINVAVHLGARRILLLGYDMQMSPTGQRNFVAVPRPAPDPQFALWIAYFATLVAPLRALGIEVLNCSRQTALRCFPRVPLERALEALA